MEKLTIPQKIHVGYRNRKGTYTGKLAYVIYTDEKGKLRKETSWNGWRDAQIPPDEFANEPTSGFVLNKGVGGTRQSWGWNVRNEYIRVFDPRGFEFEISVANLLFILQECTSIKGKGLEGEFIYSWDGTELVLLPVDCYEYQKSTEFTAAKSMKITKADMAEGCVYMHKNMNQMVYLGRHMCRKVCAYDSYGDFRRELTQTPTTPQHVFFDLKTNKYHFERGFTNLAKRETTDSHPDYPTHYSNFIESEYVSCLDEIVLTPITLDDITANQQDQRFFVELPNGSVKLLSIDFYGHRHRTSQSEFIINKSDLSNVDFDQTISKGRYYDYYITKSELIQQYECAKLYTIEYRLKSGKALRVYRYVKRSKN